MLRHWKYNKVLTSLELITYINRRNFAKEEGTGDDDFNLVVCANDSLVQI